MSAIPEGRYVDVGAGHRIHLHEAGRGPAVVFLHGSGPGASGWSNFRLNYPFLAERGRRVLVPDTLGFGRSSKPDDVDYAFELLVEKTLAFLDATGVERCALVGNSHGGALAIGVALARPERVEKLVLMAPGGLEPRERYLEMRGIRAMMKAVMTEGGMTRESMTKVLGLQLFDASRLADEIVQERLEIALEQPRRVLTTLSVPHLAPRLGEIACPVLGFWGTADQFCPPSGALTLAGGCRRARVILLGECGHWVMVEHPDFFNRTTLAFLEEP